MVRSMISFFVRMGVIAGCLAGFMLADATLGGSLSFLPGLLALAAVVAATVFLAKAWMRESAQKSPFSPPKTSPRPAAKQDRPAVHAGNQPQEKAAVHHQVA